MYAQGTALAGVPESHEAWQHRLRMAEAREQQAAKAARTWHYQQASAALHLFEGSGSSDWGAGLRALIHALLAQAPKSTR